MSSQKYHIGDDGMPSKCTAATVESCPKSKAGEPFHGEYGEVIDEVQRQFMEGYGPFATVSKAPQPELLQDIANYRPESERVVYDPEEQEIARKLATEFSSELSQLAVKSLDQDWHNAGSSDVERCHFEDGSTGYFKGFGANSHNEGFFAEFSGASSLTASISEVNAYRMAQLLGDGFDELVPETRFREVNGSIGTIQREVPEDRSVSRDFKTNPTLEKDFRKAAIFDFVTGNLDRHAENFLYEAKELGEGKRENRIRLIDNSFSFPDPERFTEINGSVFGSNQGVPAGAGRWYRYPSEKLKLEAAERKALGRAKDGVESWVQSGTISEARGRATIERIDHLLRRNRISSFSEYHDRDRLVDTNVA